MTLLSDFEALLRETMGMDSATVGSTSIERAVRERMIVTATGSFEEYWNKLRVSSHELQELV